LGPIIALGVEVRKGVGAGAVVAAAVDDEGCVVAPLPLLLDCVGEMGLGLMFSPLGFSLEDCLSLLLKPRIEIYS